MTWFKASPITALSVVLLTVTGCASPQDSAVSAGGVFDPYESANRNVHAFNIAVDRTLFRPAARGYTNVVPDPIEDSFNYFSRNLAEPGDTVNFMLQGNLREAGISLWRFVLNTTIGFGGLANPASDFGIPETDTDFGETLFVWGVGEGAYIELPFFGPSTQRDAVGVLADFFTNPLSLTPQNPADNIEVYAGITERLSDRGRFSDTVDSILYESADSYAQARVIYLQNRRFELAGDSPEAYLDPYDDVFADPYTDPYEDPYADPFAE
jgi:phospholipid-binding lipoprotein MlaA